MKNPCPAILLSIIILLMFSLPVKAQTETPPAKSTGLTGVITGEFINLSKDGKLPEKADVMVHIWDQTAEIGMLHGISLPDGTFSIEKVPLYDGSEYLVMAVYEEVTYSSKTMIYRTGQSLYFEIPIRETTSDLSLAIVDQMHVLFNVTTDGLEVKEIYILSNIGDRTIKDSIKLKDNSLATFEFPLPADADYIFFKPDSDSKRFVKFPGGFVDKDPLLPGENNGQFVVNYLVPFKGQKQLTYIAPLDTKLINFLVPADAGISINGDGLGTPEKTSMQGGANYYLYSVPELQAGKTITFSITTAPGSGIGSLSRVLTFPGLRNGIMFGGGILGLAMVVLAVWWTVKNKKNPDYQVGIDLENVRSDFDDMVIKIAQLDESYARGEMIEDDYHAERSILVKQAKELLT